MTEVHFYQEMEAKYRELTGITPDEASDTAIRLHTLAAELERFSERLEEAEKQSSPRTAVGEALELHAESRGVFRKPAAYAAGVIMFSRAGAKGAAIIPEGTVCAAADGAEYITAEPAKFGETDMQVSAAARAIRAGAAGNAAADAIVRVRQVLGFSAKNSEPFTGGCDAESDEALRRRVLDACSAPNTGINLGFYRQAAQSADGVQSASCIAGANPGEVIVYLAGNGNAPVPETVKTAVQDKLNRMREPFAKVIVQDAAVLSTDISLAVEKTQGTKVADVCEALQAAVQNKLSGLAAGEKLTLAALARVIMQSGLAENWKILSPAQDVIPDASQVVRAGTVTVTGWGA